MIALISAGLVAMFLWACETLSRGQYRFPVASSITFLLLVASMLLPLWLCFFRPHGWPHKRLDLCQPGSVFAIHYYAYVVLPAIMLWWVWDSRGEYVTSDPVLLNQGLVLGLIGVGFFGLGYRLGPDFGHLLFRDGRRGPGEWLWLRQAACPIAIALLLLVGLIFRLIYFKRYGLSSVDVVRQLNPMLRHSEQVRISGVEIILGQAFDAGILLWVFRCVVGVERSFKILPLLGIGVIFSFLTGAKRSSVAPLLLFYVVWEHYLKRPLGVRKGLVIGALAALLLAGLLLLRALLPLMVSGNLPKLATNSRFSRGMAFYYVNSAEFASFEMILLAIKSRDRLIRAAGGWLTAVLYYNFSFILYLVPHMVWPDKPQMTDLSNVFTRFAVDPGNEITGIAETMFGSLYLLAGLGGVGLGMFVIGVLFRNYYSAMRPWEGRPLRVYLYGVVSLMAFQLLRFGDLSFTAALFIQSHLIEVLPVLVVSNLGQPPAHHLPRQSASSSV